MGLLSDVLLLVALLLMAFATIIAVVTSYYLYRWRRIRSLEGKVVTVPEELIARLAAIDSELKAVRSAVAATDTGQKKQIIQIHQEIDRTNKVIAQLFEASSAMQSALDQRDTEIKRFKEGYDVELLRRVVRRFIRVKGAVADAKSHDATHMSAIDQIGRLLDDALDECGVEEAARQSVRFSRARTTTTGVFG